MAVMGLLEKCFPNKRGSIAQGVTNSSYTSYVVVISTFRLIVRCRTRGTRTVNAIRDERHNNAGMKQNDMFKACIQTTLLELTASKSDESYRFRERKKSS